MCSTALTMVVHADKGPGFVATPIWDKAEKRGTVTGYEGTPYRDMVGKIFTWSMDEGRRGYPPERIGRYRNLHQQEIGLHRFLVLVCTFFKLSKFLRSPRRRKAC